MKKKRSKKVYVDLKDVKETTTNIGIVKCRCGKEYESLYGASPELYREYRQKHKWTPNRIVTGKESAIFFCHDCGYIFSEEELDKNWKNREELALICPKCDYVVSRSTENKAYQGYMCPKCSSVLEYFKNRNHGSGKVKVRSTTDYFHGMCPNCRLENDERYGMMVLQGEIIIGSSEGCKGRLRLPLECQNCGYRDVVKIATPLGRDKEIKITYE